MTLRKTKPTVLKPYLAISTVIFWWSVTAMARAEGSAATPFDLEQILTQGGLLGFALLLGWSYRKDLVRWADDRVASEQSLADQKAQLADEKLAFNQARIDEALRYHRSLETMQAQMIETLRGNSAALAAHTTALTLNTQSTDRLAASAQKLDERMERVEHQQ